MTQHALTLARPAGLNEAQRLLEAAANILTHLSISEYQNQATIPQDPKARARLWLKSVARRDVLLVRRLPEGAWRILVDLFVNEGGKPISISSACLASGHAPTTALRWIAAMVKMGVLTKRFDPTDGRKAYIELTPKSLNAVLAFLDSQA